MAIEIPGPLLDAVKEGRAALFLGAGASRGSTDGKGSHIPVGKELARLIDANKITPVVSQTFSLSEIAKAQQQIATGHTRGKLAIQVAEEPKA